MSHNPSWGEITYGSDDYKDIANSHNPSWGEITRRQRSSGNK
ncbi:Uncharacterized protein dnm_042610 [Desulfonema magnum]|uniref:Uncharacterized protein n=1 Tax=Desulfonema magnum TaxID=45655 RepID=A0A975BM41_9BACT|nr:Uncharacterized protein dnm_042610 [Desulfonema magnum]